MLSDNPNALERVRTEPIAWLTTVSGAGVPSTAPVWFYLEDDGSITIYSRDPSVRVRNLAANPNVTLHLEGNGKGGAILVLNGTATIDTEGSKVSSHDAYVAKYRPFLDAYGWTPEWFEEQYPTRIRMEISSVRG